MRADLSSRPQQPPHKPDSLIGYQHDPGFRKHPETNTGSLQILQHGDRRVATVRHCSNGFQRGGVALLRAMRKIQARDIHAGLDQPIQHGRFATGRADRTDDFGSSHGNGHA